jgi:hypothetical protein
MLNSLYTVNRSTEPCTCEHESHHAAGRPSSHVRVACRGRGPAACRAGMHAVTDVRPPARGASRWGLELRRQLGEELPHGLVDRGEWVPVASQHQHRDVGGLPASASISTSIGLGPEGPVGHVPSTRTPSVSAGSYDLRTAPPGYTCTQHSFFVLSFSTRMNLKIGDANRCTKSQR